MSAPHTHKYTSYIYTTIHYKWPHRQFLPSALKHIKNTHTHTHTQNRDPKLHSQISDISRHPLGMHTIVIKANWWLWSTLRASVIMQLYMLRECSSNVCGGVILVSYIIISMWCIQEVTTIQYKLANIWHIHTCSFKAIISVWYDAYEPEWY